MELNFTTKQMAQAMAELVFPSELGPVQVRPDRLRPVDLLQKFNLDLPDCTIFVLFFFFLFSAIFLVPCVRVVFLGLSQTPCPRTTLPRTIPSLGLFAGPPSAGPPPFFFPLPPPLSLFFLSWEVFSFFCETRRPVGRRGSHKMTPENHKIEKKVKMGRERDKTAKFRAPSQSKVIMQKK